MKRALVAGYGLLAYALFFASFLYLIAFLANVFVPVSVDVGPEAPTALALIGNVGLVLLFGLQHSVMARPAFKRAWAKVVPDPMERSTYVLATTVVLVALMALWRPMPGVIWDLTGTPWEYVGWGVFAFGWLFLLTSTFLVNHFDLFGLRQVALFAMRREPAALQFTTRFFYKFVRHPIYLGWMIAMWATPTMTVGHLVFALSFSLYLIVAVPLEERDLVALHGDRYRDYQRSVPAVLPRLTPATTESPSGVSA